MTAQAMSPAGERGVILVAVLWLVASLALAISAFNASVRTNSALVRAELSIARITSLADAGLEIAVGHLLTNEASQWVPDGRPYSVGFGGGRLTIRIQDCGGLMDLSRTKSDLLREVLSRIARNRRDADRHYDRIMAQREPVEPNPTPSDGKRKAQSPDKRQKRLAPFLDLSQLESDSGAEVTEEMSQVLTVYNPTGSINLATAPAVLLRSLPGMDEGRVRDILEARKEAALPRLQLAALPSILVGQLTQSVKPGPAFTITVNVSHPAFAKSVQSVTTVLLKKGSAMPFYILSKQRTAF